jgi:membrane protein DedA with SNARE-associated domain
METFLAIKAFIWSSKYLLLFIGCYAEGTLVMMAGGVLWHLGQVEFWPMYIALFSADFLSDIMWYLLGYFGARPLVGRYGHYVGMTPEVMAKVERRFNTHHDWILATSKLTMGFGFAIATLTTAGMLRVSFLRYIVINGGLGLIWVYAMVMVGYYFGNLLEAFSVPKSYKIGGALILIALAGVVMTLINRRLAKSDW